MFRKRAHSNGFTLTEIMITIGLIGLLATIAVHSITRASLNTQKMQITNNLRILDNAFSMSALDQQLDEDDIDMLAISAADEYIRSGFAALQWPGSAANIPEETSLRGEISITFAGLTFTCDDPGGN